MNVVVVSVLALLLGAAEAEPLVVKTSLWTSDSLTWGIPNGDLEAGDAGGFTGWKPWQKGYSVDERVSHSGRLSARCSNASEDDQHGVHHVVELSQVVPTPITVECWSKAEGVPLGGDREYVLHLDINYADGSALWGDTTPFKSGTHDWQRVTRTFVPTKPVKAAGVTAMLRGRTGTVWFDDIQVWSVDLPAGRTVTCYVSPIKALLLVRGKLARPSVTIGKATIAFAVEIESGCYLEFLSPTDCRLYGLKGELLQVVTPEGTAPKLRRGPDAVRFRCDAPPGLRARACVTVMTQGKALKPDAQK